MARQKQLGNESKAVDRGGRPPALKPGQTALLLTIVSQMPHATLDELASELVERTHAWNERWRRMVMHHDRWTSISTAWVWLATAG